MPQIGLQTCDEMRQSEIPVSHISGKFKHRQFVTVKMTAWKNWKKKKRKKTSLKMIQFILWNCTVKMNSFEYHVRWNDDASIALEWMKEIRVVIEENYTQNGCRLIFRIIIVAWLVVRFSLSLTKFVSIVRCKVAYRGWGSFFSLENILFACDLFRAHKKANILSQFNLFGNWMETNDMKRIKIHTYMFIIVENIRHQAR